jgi:hypothetical protein
MEVPMPKPAKKRLSGSKAKQTRTARPTKPAVVKTAKRNAAGTKQARVIAMLQSPTGATIAALMKETGWQRHSSRGFLAGVVRKKLKLNLISDKIDGRRTYRIHAASNAKAGERASNHSVV